VIIILTYKGNNEKSTKVVSYVHLGQLTYKKSTPQMLAFI